MKSLLEWIINRKRQLSTVDWQNMLNERKYSVLWIFKNTGIELPKLGDLECMFNMDICSSGCDPSKWSGVAVIGGAGLTLDTQGIFWRLFDETKLPQKKGIIKEYKLMRVLGFTENGEWVIATILYYYHDLEFMRSGNDVPIEIQIYRTNEAEIFKLTGLTPENLWYEIGGALNRLSINYGDNREWIPGTWRLATILRREKQLIEALEAECAA